jgi:hypothetical protein
MASQGVGGRVAVAASCALLGVCLAGGPLYVSAAASEAVQLQLDDTCLSDVAVHLPYSSDPQLLASLDQVLTTLRQHQEPVVTHLLSTSFRLADSPAVERRLVLVHRDGQEAQFEPPLTPVSTDELAVPAYLVDTGDFVPGDTELSMQAPASFEIAADGSIEPGQQPDPVSMRVTATYPTIPVRPEPTFWCGFRALLRPNTRGDLPPPMMLTTIDTIDQFESAEGDWEVRPIVAGMTRDDAHAFQRRHDAAIEQVAADFGVDVELFRRQFAPSGGIGTLADRGDTVADLVGRTMAPVQLTGVAVSLLVLGASGVMVARERRRELRLVAIRGGGPAASMPALLATMAVPTLGGAIVGLGLALLGVRTLGPTPELEAGPLRVAIVSAVIGGFVALVLVSVITAVVGDREVDADHRRVRLRHVPFELIVPVLATAAFVRLDRVGGVRLVGADTRGGDLLAQSFPLLALATPVAILVRPMRAVVRRLRRIGRRLPDALRLGVRRSVAEPTMTVMVLLASAFAAGCLVLSSTLLVSAERQLLDKATTYVGSDESIRVFDELGIPTSLSDRATIVGRTDGRVEGTSVAVLAIDLSSFLDAVHWRGDPELSRLPDLLEQLGRAGARTPAIVVGDVPDSFDLDGRARDSTLAVDVIARLDHFPGFSNGKPLVVVDTTAVEQADLGGVSSYVWVRDPPPDAVQRLRDAGFQITGDGQSVQDVFDVISFRAVGWSYSALGAFGVFVALVVLMMQLLAIDARRQRRQAAYVVMRRMGFGRRDLAVSSLVEVAMPLVIGVIAGVSMGVAVAEASVRRLDTLRQLRPAATVVVDVGSIVAVGVGTLVAVALLTLLTVVSTLRAKPLEVMRGTV